LAGVLDGALAAATGALLAGRVPVDRWPAVLGYAALAVREWLRGYREGLPPLQRATAAQNGPAA
jgi:hypothetical protein